MRAVVVIVMLVGCWTAPSRQVPVPAGAPKAFADYLVGAPRTDAAATDAVGLPDGAIAVLACVHHARHHVTITVGDAPPDERTSPDDDPADRAVSGWPGGGSLAVIDRTGAVVARAATRDCGGHLIAAGADLVRVVDDPSEIAQPMRVERFAAAGLAPRGEITLPDPGILAALAGRSDGALAVAEQVDGAGADVAIVGADGKDRARWRLAGRRVTISQIAVDGDGVIVAGVFEESVALAPELSIAAPADPDAEIEGMGESRPFIARVGPTHRWLSELVDSTIEPVPESPPRFAQLPGGGIAVAWGSFTPPPDGRAHPELAPFGTLPRTEVTMLWAAVDANGRVRPTHAEPIARRGRIVALAALADGTVAELQDVQREVRERASRDPRCKPRKCRPLDGVEREHYADMLSVRRHDAVTQAMIGEARIAGEAVVPDVHVIAGAGREAVVVGTAVGELVLPRGRVASATTFADPCGAASAAPAASLGLYALRVAPVECNPTLEQKSILFAIRLSP